MKGICFKEPMFLATVEGRKTQTRRIINPQPDGDIYKNSFGYFDAHRGSKAKEHKPKYKFGETVYLKEPYFLVDYRGGLINSKCGKTVIYKYGTRHENNKGIWKNKLFMPEKYARYFIEITGVRCERLQDISFDDILKEGIYEEKNIHSGRLWYFSDKKHYGGSVNPHETYADLIDRIDGKGTWDSNPYVWVYSFILKK